MKEWVHAMVNSSILQHSFSPYKYISNILISLDEYISGISISLDEYIFRISISSAWVKLQIEIFEDDATEQNGDLFHLC